MLKAIKSVFGGGGKTPKRMQILPQDVTIEFGPGQTLLEAALANGINYPHDCTVGNCASCKARLKQGRVREATPFSYTLSKAELDAGYILSCQAFPRDELTVVEIDSPAVDAPAPETFAARIVATESLTHDILKVSVQADREVNYVAGQYANLRVAGMLRHRSYSFATAPQRSGRNLLEFYIRKVPGGAFTEALFKGELNEQPLDMEAPQGTFHLHAGDAPMLCVAGGSGLAPLISVLEYARTHKLKRRCTLLFGARTQADLYQLDLIRDIAEHWQEEFKFVPVLSHEPADSAWAGARGFVTEHILPEFCAGAEGYLCGPPPMIDAAIDVMLKYGIPIDKIFYDKFTDARDGAPSPA